MDIRGFAAGLAEQIEGAHPSGRLLNEGAFERQHVIVPAWELSRLHPEIRVFSHPEIAGQGAHPRVTRAPPSSLTVSRAVHVVGLGVRRDASRMYSEHETTLILLPSIEATAVWRLKSNGCRSQTRRDPTPSSSDS